MASTYVNDLRLNEMATGDASGTWGTITNTNLELIAEAFSFGTEAITTNADTHTTTIADGATDPGRSIFLKYTGTLDSACTITIGPNTVSKFWVIENATSGSQNIIIKQGSGATVTIPNGEVKAIYSDGAGSGGAMVDAFANLKVSDAAQTNITSLGTLTTLTVDDITINGSTISDGADLTVDVEGDIILDANGGNVTFKDDGTAIGDFVNSSSDFVIESKVQDKDILFKGDDGGSGITALTLDMSEAGAATFNSGATFGGAVSGTSADFDGGVTIDNITIDGTEIDLSSGSLTIDSADDIVLDADGGTIVFKDGGTEIAFLSLDNSGFFDIYSSVSDNDIRIRGNDGGSTVDAVIFDMSEEGNATFNNNIIFGDNGKALFGAGTDLALFSDGSDGNIQSSGDLRIDTAGSDIRLLVSSTQYGSLSESSSDFLITASVQDKDIIFRGNDGGSGINALTLDMSEAGAATFNNNVTAFSDERLKDNIETLEDGLAKVEQLRGVTYTRDGRENIGVIAQEVEKILPEIVLTADDEMGTKSVDYSRLTAVLIEAVKDLSARVKELENK
tara:strand:- start:164 stop:1855 length:1692 start_codon:yes stop_codon:yes gene_type:complete